MAHQLLGQYRLDIGKNHEALQHIDQAIAATDARPDVPTNPLFKARLYHLRSQAHQRLRQPELALQNAQQALNIAQTANHEQAIAQYQRELEIIKNHPDLR